MVKKGERPEARKGRLKEKRADELRG